MNNKGLKKLLADKNPEVPKTKVKLDTNGLLTTNIPTHYVHYENSSPSSRTINIGNTVWTIVD